MPEISVQNAVALSLDIAPTVWGYRDPTWSAEELQAHMGALKELSFRYGIALTHVEHGSLECLRPSPTGELMEGIVASRVFAIWAKSVEFELPPRFPGASYTSVSMDRASPPESQAKPIETITLSETPSERQDRRLLLFRKNGGDFKKGKDGGFALCGKFRAKKKLMDSEKAAFHPCCDDKGMREDLLRAFARERATNPTGLIHRL
jgi:hypothetical protein